MLLYQLVYVSKMTQKMSHEEIECLVAHGKYNNHKNGLTGCLIYSKKCFMQYIEGDIFKLNHLFNRITKDKRHQEVLLIGLQQISHRLFKNYSVCDYNVDFKNFNAVSDVIDPSEYEPFPMSLDFAIEYFHFIRYNYPDKHYSDQFPKLNIPEKNM